VVAMERVTHGAAIDLPPAFTAKRAEWSTAQGRGDGRPQTKCDSDWSGKPSTKETELKN